MTAQLHLASYRGDQAERDSAPVPIRVVLADDHAPARRSLRLLLEGEDGIDVVAEAQNLATVVHHIRGHALDVLVLDLQMPDGSSIETIRHLHEQVPGTQIVLLTMEQSPAFAQRALDVGAVGLVVKDHADTELPDAVRRAARADEYVSPRVAAGLDALRRMVSRDRLSPRETEVLRLIALGFTSAEIARQLHLSRRTIETHRSNVQRELGLRTRAELVNFALRRHLICA